MTVLDPTAQNWLERGRGNFAQFCLEGFGIKLHPKQIEAANKVLERGVQYILLTWANRAGKFQPVGEPVLTPTGWRPIGDLRVGDDVFAGDGMVTQVVDVFPQGVQPAYRLTFDDGATTLAGGPHLWKVRTPAARFHVPGSDRGDGYVRVNTGYEEWSVLTTDEIRTRWGSSPRPGQRCAIPVPSPVEFPAQEVPIDPYALGLLIGDGGLSAGAVRYSTKDPELVEALRAALPGCRVRATGYPCDYAVTGDPPIPGRRIALVAGLRSLGLWGSRSADKFVPEVYLRNEPSVRLAVLQGLMDTDGTVGLQGSVDFASVSERLTDDVVEIVRSLGGKARKVRRQTYYTYLGVRKAGQPSFRVTIRLRALPLFRLERKLDRVKCIRPPRPERLLLSIVPAGEADSVCIMVAHPDQTYITRDFIVTHNSTTLMLLHCFALAYKLGMDPPHGRTQSEWNKDFTTRWIPAGYRTLHCAPLNSLSLKAFRELQEILKGTSVAQRDPVTGERRPAPLAALYDATKVRDDTGADHIILRCATGGVTDFLSTEGGAARLEGEPWWLITWDEWPSTEGGAENARFVLEVRLTNRAADFGAPIVLTGTLTDDMEHLAKEWLAKCEDNSNPDWWGNHAARAENPSANLHSISVAERNLDPEDYARAVLGLAGGVKGRLIPGALIENCFRNDLPDVTPPHEKDGVSYDPLLNRRVDTGSSPYTYLHLWDIAISEADNVGSVYRLPKDYKFSVTSPIEGVRCKIIPGSRTLTDSQIIATIEETFLLYGGQIYIDTTDAHGKNIARELRAAGYPAHDFDFHDRTAKGYTNKEAGIIALRKLLAEQDSLTAEQSIVGVHDRDGVPVVDGSKPFGCLKIPATWKKHYDQLSILRPPPDDAKQKKDAAMTDVMLAAVAYRMRPRGAQTGSHRIVVFGGR